MPWLVFLNILLVLAVAAWFYYTARARHQDPWLWVLAGVGAYLAAQYLWDLLYGLVLGNLIFRATGSFNVAQLIYILGIFVVSIAAAWVAHIVLLRHLRVSALRGELPGTA